MPDEVSRQAGALRSFRLVCRPEHVPLVEALLRAQGFDFEPEPFFPLARKLIREPLPLGSSLAAIFGYIYIQDRSSMLPPLALSPPEGAAVLDMCASPGSKTSLLGQLVGPAGFVLGNEPNKTRLTTLRRNLQQLNLLCCCTLSYPGEKLPFAGESWKYILLDPPCSGWGTAEKNPQVLRLWQGDKIRPLITLQRRLLAEAARLLAPGGQLVYSTCTTNILENEDQIRYAQEELGLTFMPLPAPAGFSLARPEYEGAWRVDPGNGGEDGQGFFVALLQKPGTYAEAQTPNAAAARPELRAQAYILPVSALDGAYADPGLLPPGDIAVFNGTAHFLPVAHRSLIPKTTAWKGFVLGKVGKQGILRLSPHLRGLMPEAQAAHSKGRSLINLEDPAPLLPLLQGQGLQGLALDAGSGEVGLYYRDLPLCRLTLKGRRAMLPPR